MNANINDIPVDPGGDGNDNQINYRVLNRRQDEAFLERLRNRMRPNNNGQAAAPEVVLQNPNMPIASNNNPINLQAVLQQAGIYEPNMVVPDAVVDNIVNDELQNELEGLDPNAFRNPDANLDRFFNQEEPQVPEPEIHPELPQDQPQVPEPEIDRELPQDHNFQHGFAQAVPQDANLQPRDAPEAYIQVAPENGNLVAPPPVAPDDNALAHEQWFDNINGLDYGQDVQAMSPVNDNQPEQISPQLLDAIQQEFGAGVNFNELLTENRDIRGLLGVLVQQGHPVQEIATYVATWFHPALTVEAADQNIQNQIAEQMEVDNPPDSVHSMNSSHMSVSSDAADLSGGEDNNDYANNPMPLNTKKNIYEDANFKVAMYRFLAKNNINVCSKSS